MSDLLLTPCSYQMAKYAVENWHYSRKMPRPPMLCFSVWEGGRFIGCVIYAAGACRNLGRPYELESRQVLELSRVALASHSTYVSKVVAVSLRLLRKVSPRTRLVVSFADPMQGHRGGVYQAGGWIYCGKTSPDKEYIDAAGRRHHRRMISPTGFKIVYGKKKPVLRPQDCVEVPVEGKHRYLMPLDKEMRERVLPLAKPYPKRAGSSDGGTSPIQGEGGGSSPTPALPDT